MFWKKKDIIKIKYFEGIDFDQLEDYYYTEIKIGAQTVELDLNFESEKISNRKISKLNKALEKIEELASNSWKWIIADYINGGVTDEFISFHLEDYDPEDVTKLLADSNKTLNIKEQFLNTIKINRIGVYPEDAKYYVTIDYMVQNDFSNQILVVFCNKRLKLNYITIES